MEWLVSWLARVVHLGIRIWWTADPYEEGRWIWNWLRLAVWIILIGGMLYLLIPFLFLR